MGAERGQKRVVAPSPTELQEMGPSYLPCNGGVTAGELLALNSSVVLPCISGLLLQLWKVTYDPWSWSWDDFRASTYCYSHDMEREKWLSQVGISEQVASNLPRVWVGEESA